MAHTDQAQVSRSVILTERTTATEDGVTTVYSAQSTEQDGAGWESKDLSEVIEWTRGFLGARMP